MAASQQLVHGKQHLYNFHSLAPNCFYILPYSTQSSWLQLTNMPTIHSLCKSAISASIPLGSTVFIHEQPAQRAAHTSSCQLSQTQHSQCLGAFLYVTWIVNIVAAESFRGQLTMETPGCHNINNPPGSVLINSSVTTYNQPPFCSVVCSAYNDLICGFYSDLTSKCSLKLYCITYRK